MPSNRKVAIITGASRGIGRAIAIRLAQDGYNVVVNYQSNHTSAQQVLEAIRSSFSEAQAIAVQADIRNIPEGLKLLDETLKAFGRVDTVVFNAAWMNFQSIDTLTEELYELAFQTNVKGPMFFAQQVIPHLQAGSRLIFMSSVVTSANRTMGDQFLYASTKGAVEQMVRTLTRDLSAKGITVNAVNPGATDTDGFRDCVSEERAKMAAASSPFGRLGTPEDIAKVVSFVAGEDGSWVTGQIIRASGGSV